MPLSFKPDPSMNNYILSNKRVLVIATMLSVMMLVASSTQSLIPAKVFAQQQSLASTVNGNIGEVVDETLDQQLNRDDNSGDEQQGTSGGAASSTPENDPKSEVKVDSQSEEDTSRVEEDDSVQVDPIIHNSIQNDLNINVDSELVMDEEDCEEAQNEVLQGNVQQSDQQAGGEGRVGDGNVYVSPKLQRSTQFALNANVDVDVVLAEGCNPVDDITQVNAQEQDQGISSDLSSSPSGTVMIPANQGADKFAYNIGVNQDIVL